MTGYAQCSSESIKNEMMRPHFNSVTHIRSVLSESGRIHLFRSLCLLSHQSSFSLPPTYCWLEGLLYQLMKSSEKMTPNPAPQPATFSHQQPLNAQLIYKQLYQFFSL